MSTATFWCGRSPVVLYLMMEHFFPLGDKIVQL